MVPNVTQKWPEKPIRCMNMLHTTAVSLRRQSTGEMRRSVAILEPLMLHGLLLRTSSPIRWVQKAKIFSCMSMDTVASRKKLSRRWKACSNKGWKRLMHILPKKPHETQIWPNLRDQIWPNVAYQTVFFAAAKTIFFLNTCILWARFPVRRVVHVLQNKYSSMSWFSSTSNVCYILL